MRKKIPTYRFSPYIFLVSNPFTFERHLNALLNLVKMLKGGAAESFFFLFFSFLSFDLGKYISSKIYNHNIYIRIVRPKPSYLALVHLVTYFLAVHGTNRVHTYTFLCPNGQ